MYISYLIGSPTSGASTQINLVHACPDRAGTPPEGPRRLVIKAEPDAVVHRALDHRRPQATEKALHHSLSTANLA